MTRYLLTIGLACGLSVGAHAQNVAVTNAILSFEDGKLKEAKENIDKAITNDKTGAKAKTWYYRGMVYLNIANSPIEAYSQLGGDSAAIVAHRSFERAMELDVKKRQYYEQSEAQLIPATAAMFNQSIKEYQAGNHDRAIDLAKRYMAVAPEDTNVYRNLAVYASNAEDYETMKMANEKLIEFGEKDPVYYRQLAYIARTQDKDNEQALAYLQAGREAHPNDKDMMLEEIQLYQELGRREELKQKIESAITQDPSNPSLRLVLANIYDNEASNKDLKAEERRALENKAKEQYEKLIEVDPDNYDGLYNLAVINFNRRAESVRRGSNMDLRTYERNESQLKAEQKRYLDDAQKYFEQAMEVRDDDPNLYRSLEMVYTLQNNKAKAAEMKRKQESLMGAGQ